MTREEIKEEFSKLDLELVKAKADQHDKRMELQQRLNDIEKAEKANLYQHLNKCFTLTRANSYLKVIKIIPRPDYDKVEVVLVRDNLLVKRSTFWLNDVLNMTPITLEEFNLAYSRCLIQINK